MNNPGRNPRAIPGTPPPPGHGENWLAWGGGGGGGVIRAPQRRGGGSRKGALVTGQSQEASRKPLMMPHQLRREVAWKIFFQKKITPMIHPSK